MITEKKLDFYFLSNEALDIIHTLQSNTDFTRSEALEFIIHRWYEYPGTTYSDQATQQRYESELDNSPDSTVKPADNSNR